jgi:putative transcriptional regulator
VRGLSDHFSAAHDEVRAAMAIVRVTEEMVVDAIAATDWAAINAMTDEDIARQIEENPEAAPDLSKPRRP